MSRSNDFFNAIEDVYKRPISENVMQRAKKSLIDYIAVTCAGAKFQKEKLKKYYKFAEPEKGAYLAIGTGWNVTLKEAVFLNGPVC